MGTTIPVGLAGTLAFRTYADMPDLRYKVWNPAVADFIDKVAPTRSRFLRDELLRRFTRLENYRLNLIRLDPVSLLQTRAELETVRDYLATGATNDISDNEIVQCVDTMLDALVAAGYMTAPQRTTRRSAILAPITEPL